MIPDEPENCATTLAEQLDRIEGKLDELLARPAIALTGIKVTAMPASEKQTIVAEWSEG